MSLINCEINFIWTWPYKYTLSNDTKATIFAITDTKLYVLVVTLSTQDNAKRLEQLKSCFKRTINWKKYEPKVSVQAPNLYLDFLINPRKIRKIRKIYTKYYLPTDEIKHYNVVIDGQIFFNELVKNNLITHENIRKTATG